jgi:hypothetical protein
VDGSNWASGRWQVLAGMEGEFVERWTAWLKATSGNGMSSARELCDEFVGGDFGVASAIDAG